jgi:hypothetical protein
VYKSVLGQGGFQIPAISIFDERAVIFSKALTNVLKKIDLCHCHPCIRVV